MDFLDLVVNDKNTNLPELIKNQNSEFELETSLKALNLFSIEQQAESLCVLDQESAQKAVEMGLQARKLRKAIEEKRKEILKPVLEYQKTFSSEIGKYTEQLERLEKNLTVKLSSWNGAERINTDEGNAIFRSEYQITVEDENVVPREFLSVDTKKIEEAIKLGRLNFDGIKLTKKTKIEMRIKGN